MGGQADNQFQGDVEKAEELQRIAYNGRLKVKGAEDMLTLQSINSEQKSEAGYPLFGYSANTHIDLAHTLRRQGKTCE